MTASPLRPAVFFDRDDTLIVDVPYLGDPALVQLFPDTRPALQRLAEARFALVLVSNQSGIARGLITHAQVQAVHRELAAQLHPLALDGFYYSPDGPDQPSTTRKPAPGLLLAAAQDLQLDLATSFMIGDKRSDVQAGRAAGCRTILLTRPPVTPSDAGADFIAASLLAAVDWIFTQSLPSCASSPSSPPDTVPPGSPEKPSPPSTANP